MKRKIKFALAFVVALFFVNCEISVRKGNAQNSEIYGESNVVLNGMTYHVWYVRHNTSQTGYDVHVVNLTKDKLECQYYEMMLKKK